ncbi:MAG: hypothetical protein ACRC9Q_02920 [Bacteroidales bacterium]
MIPTYLKRFRNKRGFGVHSPFAFHLITEIIREKYPFYKFEEIDQAVAEFCAKENKHITAKKFHILFRLINHLHSNRVLEIGSYYGLSTLSMALCGGEKQIQLLPLKERDYARTESYVNQFGLNNIELLANEDEIAGTFDFIYIHGPLAGLSLFETYKRIKSHAGDTGVILIDRIRKDRETHKEWKKILKYEAPQMVIDEDSRAMLFLDKRLNPKRYMI